MTTWLLIDCHYLMYRAHYAMGQLRHEGQATGATFGFFRDLIALSDRFDTNRFVFCFDYGESRRCDDLECYKQNRKKNPRPEEELLEHKAIKKQIHQLRTSTLYKLGFRNILFQGGYEADDIIASVVQNSIAYEDEAIIVSSDSDLLQLLESNRVLMYNPAKKKITNAKSFRQEWGIPPCFWADVKAMAGCTSDNIPGIRGVGEKTACKYLAGKLDSTSKKYKSITDNVEITTRNLRLVKLPYKGVGEFELQDDKPNRKAWKEITGEMGMESIRTMGVF